jgi:hypothetical protein
VCMCNIRSQQFVLIDLLLHLPSSRPPAATCYYVTQQQHLSLPHTAPQIRSCMLKNRDRCRAACYFASTKATAR